MEEFTVGWDGRWTQTIGKAADEGERAAKPTHERDVVHRVTSFELDLRRDYRRACAGISSHILAPPVPRFSSLHITCSKFETS